MDSYNKERMMHAEYWFNTDVRNKYFDGYNPEARLVYVGTLEVTNLDDAYRAFNRIDAPVPVLDEAEAPSMSMGDVIHLTGSDDKAKNGWYVVASFGFTTITEPSPDLLVRGVKVSSLF